MARYMRAVYVTVAALGRPHPAAGGDGETGPHVNHENHLTRIGVSLHIAATIADLKQAISLHTHIAKDKLLIVELYEDSFQRTFADYQSLNIIHDTDDIYAVEIPVDDDVKNVGGDWVGEGGGGDEEEHERLLLVTLHRVGAGNQSKRFGGLYPSYIGRGAGFVSLQNTLLDTVDTRLKTEVNRNELSIPLFKVRVHDGIPGKCYLPTDVDHPLYMPTVDRAISSCDADPIHVKLSVEWEPEVKSKVLCGVEESVREDVSVQEQRNLNAQPVTATLCECFDLYTQEEKLCKENAWRCSYCKKLQQATVKLSLWSLPDIFVIHLKRFRQVGSQRTKLTTFVDFPIYGLDMTKHIAKRGSDAGMSGAGSLNVLRDWSPWRRRPNRVVTAEDRMYDLYGVCNHSGNLTAGHYTAFCKNPADGQWYCFDDSDVTPISEGDVITENAYLLFYQRRSLISSSSGSSSSAVSSASSSTVSSDHWCYRIPDFQPAQGPVNCSQSQNDLLSDFEANSPNTNKSGSRDSGVSCDGLAPADRSVFARNSGTTASLPSFCHGKKRNMKIAKVDDGDDDDEVTLTAKSDDSHGTVNDADDDGDGKDATTGSTSLLTALTPDKKPLCTLAESCV